MYIKKAVVKENGAICVHSRDQKRNNKKGDVSSNMGECEVEWIMQPTINIAGAL